jgi:hypothetical protein
MLMKPILLTSLRSPLCNVALAFIFALSAAVHAGAATTVEGRVFNVRDFGAAADGQTLDTTAINRAIHACATNGGGRVLFPPGRYVSGTVHLQSRVELFLDAGAVLLGATNLDLYQTVAATNASPELPVSRWHRALILGQNAQDIAIAGQGIIDGRHVFDPRGEERMRGPHTILLGNCRNFVLRDVLMTNAGNYALLFFFTDAVTVTNATFAGGWDGVHFRGSPQRWCHDVLITGCRFYTGDDAIAGSYWTNVVITNCVINSSCNGIRLIGPALHSIITHCDFPGPGVHPHRTSGAARRTNMLAGICLQPSAWGGMPGPLDDFRIEDITMKNVAAPLHIVTRAGNPAGRIIVERLRATGVYRAPCSVESWGESRFNEVVFRDVWVDFEGGGSPEDAQMPVRMPGVDARKLPAWGFYARGVNRLVFENVTLSCERDEARPMFLGDSVGQLALDRFAFSSPPAMTDWMSLTNVDEITLHETALPASTPRCAGLKITAGAADGHFVAGQSFTATGTVTNGANAGLGKVEVRAADQTVTRWVWLQPNARSEILFPGLVAKTPGEIEVSCGGVTERVRIEP